MSKDLIVINDINLWAHVGVYEHERLTGQEFNLDLYLWIDTSQVIANDTLSSTLDYGQAIKSVQEISNHIECNTIEFFANSILETLEKLYGSIPLKIKLTKVSPPVNGYLGSVKLIARRNFHNLLDN